MILEGMQRTLADHQETCLLIEFFPEGLRLSGYDPMQLLEQLTVQNFIAYDVRRPTGKQAILTPSDVMARLNRLEKRHVVDDVYTNLLLTRAAVDD